MQLTRDGVTFDDDQARLQPWLGEIVGWLGATYWASSRTPAEIVRSWEHAGVVAGLYAEDRVVGCCRAVTDFARFAYLSDVFVVEAWRGRGLGSWMVATVLDHPDLAGVRWLLDTRDAHGVYARLGFVAVDERTMQRLPVRPLSAAAAVDDQGRA